MKQWHARFRQWPQKLPNGPRAPQIGLHLLAVCLWLVCLVAGTPATAVGVGEQTRLALPVPFAVANRGGRPAAFRARWQDVKRATGQMLMVGFPGTSVRSAGVRNVLRLLRSGAIGGVIIRGDNVSSPAQLRALTRALRRAAPRGEPPLIAIDQEGGFVARLRPRNGHRASNFSARTVARKCSVKQAERLYAAMACELAAAGITMNFGPVVDVDVTGTANPIIGRLRRSFSPRPRTVTAYAAAFIRAHRRFGVATVAKHFPGHGASTLDSHKTLARVPLWEPTELIPYRELGKLQGTMPDAVMIGHLYHPDFSERSASGTPLPATLSRVAVTGLLRRKVGYRGIAMTDDLEMDGVRQGLTRAGIAIAAQTAGNDLLLFNNSRPYRADLALRLHSEIFNAVLRRCRRLGATCRAVQSTFASAARIKAVRRAAAHWLPAPSSCPVRSLRATCQ